MKARNNKKSKQKKEHKVKKQKTIKKSKIVHVKRKKEKNPKAQPTKKIEVKKEVVEKKEPKEKKPKKEKSLTVEYKSLVPKKVKVKTTISPGQIQRILNTGHADDLYITLKLLDEYQILKIITYFKKHHTKMHKKKDLAKIIVSSKTRADLLTNIKNYLVSGIKKDYEELKQQASSLRKKGKDMLIEELKIMSIPSKIRFFEATEDKHDFYVAKNLVDKIKQEISVKI